MPPSDALPTLKSDRVLLRWLTDSDVPSLFEIFSSPEVTRYWSSTAFTDREQAATLLLQIHDFFRQGTLNQWGLALPENDEVIGTCTLAALDRQNRRAELGFALNREYWKKGYMNEALEVLLRHAFDGLELHRLEADVDPRNQAAIRTLDRLGFQREGYLRERWLVGGEIHDTVLYGLLRREWPGGGA